MSINCVIYLNSNQSYFPSSVSPIRFVQQVEVVTALATPRTNALSTAALLTDHVHLDSASVALVIFQFLSNQLFNNYTNPLKLYTVTISSCGSRTSLNGTYWTNPGYSSSYATAGECTLAVTKCNSNICQLRC